MTRLQLLKVDLASQKVCKPTDSLKFDLTFNNQKYLNEDVQFEVLYIGDTYNDQLDQLIGDCVIGPLEEGKLFFSLETNPIDLTKVPIKTLFGLTTILIVGKFRGETFIRIGYVVDVKHKNVDSEKLIEPDQANEEDLEEESGEEETGEEESGDEESGDLEESNDEECCDEGCCDAECNDGKCCETGCNEGKCCETECKDGECCDEEECNEGACCKEGSECEGCSGCEEEEECAEGSKCEGCSCCEEEERCCDEEDCNCEAESDEKATGYEKMITDALLNSRREKIPLETPILANVDEFEYKGMQLKKSCIELHFLEKPIIQVFDIDWCDEAEVDGVKESSESDENEAKKQKIE